MYIPLVVQEVVGAVVADVAEDATAVDCHGGVPVVEEDGVRELPEGRRKHEEQRRGHHEAQAVHWEVVVNAVKEEVKSERGAVVGQVVVDVEQTPVHAVLDDGPDAEADDPIRGCDQRIAEMLRREVRAVDDGWEPESGHDVPGSLRERLEKVAEQRRTLTTLVVSRTVDLLQVELLAEAAIPDLH